jgi:hypothetical protein
MMIINYVNVSIESSSRCEHEKVKQKLTEGRCLPPEVNLSIVCLWQTERDKSQGAAQFFSRDIPHDKCRSLMLPKRCLLMTINQSRVGYGEG